MKLNGSVRVDAVFMTFEKASHVGSFNLGIVYQVDNIILTMFIPFK